MENRKYRNSREVEIIGQREMPHSTETEMAVLGSLIQFNELYGEYSDMLSPDLFYDDKTKAVFGSIKGVMDGGKEANINSLSDYAQAGKPCVLTRADFVQAFQYSSPKTFKQDLDRLVELHRRRALWRRLMLAADKVLDPSHELGSTVSNLSTVLDETMHDDKADGIFSFQEAVDALKGIVSENSKGKTTALKTGFHLFDEFFLLRPATLTIIAAFTSVGKTALAMNITKHVAEQNIPVGYYSLEMGKEDLAARVLGGDAGVPASAIMNRRLGDYELGKFHEAASSDGSLPIFIDERTAASFGKTVRSIRAMAKRRGIRLAVIDYLQIYNQEGDNNELALAAMARAAKNLSTELKIAIILLSQLNRSADHPSIKMLRGSGQIEESADNIVLIDRPEAYPDNRVNKYEGEFREASVHGTAKLILAKGRGVGTAAKLVGFEPRYTQFYELDAPQQDSNLPF